MPMSMPQTTVGPRELLRPTTRSFLEQLQVQIKRKAPRPQRTSPIDVKEQDEAKAESVSAELLVDVLKAAGTKSRQILQPKESCSR